jgi:hypothetical protein
LSRFAGVSCIVIAKSAGEGARDFPFNSSDLIEVGDDPFTGIDSGVRGQSYSAGDMSIATQSNSLRSDRMKRPVKRIFTL